MVYYADGTHRCRLPGLDPGTGTLIYFHMVFESVSQGALDHVGMGIPIRIISFGWRDTSPIKWYLSGKGPPIAIASRAY